MFNNDVAYQRLWRRIVSRYPVVRNVQYVEAVEQLFKKQPELTYQSLKSLSEERERFEPFQIQAYFSQLLQLQQKKVEAIDPEYLLDVLLKLDIDQAWRWFHFGLHQKKDQLQSYFSSSDEQSQMLFNGLKKGISAFDVERILRYYADALTDFAQPLKFHPKDSTAPLDHDSLHLPDQLMAYADGQASVEDEESLHFWLYKWLITHEQSHRQAGTYFYEAEDEESGRQSLIDYLQSFTDPLLAEALFHLFEDVRIESHLLRQYPGFQIGRNQLMNLEFAFRPEPESGRERFLEALLQQLHWDKSHIRLEKSWKADFESLLKASETLREKTSSVHDTVRITDLAYEQIEKLFDEPRLRESLSLTLLPYELPLLLDPPPSSSSPADQMRQLWNEPSEDEDAEEDTHEDSTEGDISFKQAFKYDEWDYREQMYRTNWCALHEQVPEEVTAVSALDAPQVAQIRRAFEWMAEEDWTRQRRQLEGDEIDLDAWVEGMTDLRAGQPLPEKLYTQQLRKKRDLCAAILLDQSDSTARLTPTGEPVISVEREALRYLCEALEALRDEYAIYTYSGDGRGQVDCYPLKKFEERYGLTVQYRLEALQPLAQNRDGCVIRHIAKRMETLQVRTKLLLHITDGKPWDHGYTQKYALEDTKKAIQEARAQGIKVFGVICDPHAPAYVKNTYGPGRSVVLKDINGLSDLLLGLYRKITW